MDLIKKYLGEGNISEKDNELKAKAVEYLDYYEKNVGKNMKKVHREIKTNVVGNMNHSNKFVEMVWSEFKKRYPS